MIGRAETTPVLRCGALELTRSDDAWLTPAAAEYALQRLWRLVSGGEPRESGPVRLRFNAASRADVDALLATAPGALQWKPVFGLLPPGASLPAAIDRLPLLLSGDVDGAVIAASGEAIDVATDLVSATFLLLSRWEESVTPQRDDRGRVPSGASLAARQGFLDRPVLDQWALVLRAWLSTGESGFNPAPTGFQVKLSHDVDAPLRYDRAAALALYPLGAVRRGGPSSGLREMATGMRSLRDWRADPYYRGMRHLMAVSEANGLKSAFYFKTSDRGPLDTGYNLAVEPYRSILAEVVDRGHEVGFHPGFDAFDHPDVFAEEKRRLDVVLGHSRYGGRHHHLRFSAPETWAIWEAHGLSYDSTVGYSDAPGFRCGTCHPFPVFDFVADRPLELVEVPLVVMETTLFSYMHLPALQAQEMILTLAERCREVGGVFTLLWHNSSFHGSYAGWADIYQPVVEQLARIAGTATAA